MPRAHLQRTLTSAKLDCVFCGKRVGVDFNSLAYHVRHVCPRAPSGIIEQRDQETRPMAKKRTTPEPDEPRTGWASPTDVDDTGSWSGERVQFLKASDIGKAGARATLTILAKPEARIVASKFGEQIILPVKLGPKRYDWGFGMNSGNHKRLHARFKGKAPAGKVRVEVMAGASGNLFVAVSD